MISTFVITDCMKKDVIIKPSWHVHMAYFLKIIITQRPYTQFGLFDGYLVKKQILNVYLLARNASLSNFCLTV